jgi:hypothetical protein
MPRPPRGKRSTTTDGGVEVVAKNSNGDGSVSRSSIYQLIWSEQLVPIRIGRSVRFSVGQLEQFVIDRIAQTNR